MSEEVTAIKTEGIFNDIKEKISRGENVNG
jgi:hypothetical protein